jgi:hypothetical protein
VTFLVQFIQFRRGIPEVSRTLQLAVSDAAVALAEAKSRTGAGTWPRPTGALRVMDDGGRTLIDWVVPGVLVATAEPILAHANSPERSITEPRSSPSWAAPRLSRASADAPSTRRHVFHVGQAVSYAEDGKPESWRGGYDIIELRHPGPGEPQYAIRNADQSCDRIVQEHELREDLGARAWGY